MALGMVAASFAWQGSRGFSLWDEGFLWYGAQRVVQGEIPVRDFMSYDPGRYYWTALAMKVQGDTGIVSLRRAVAVFQCIGLFAALHLIAATSREYRNRNVPYLLVAGLTLMLWMFPRHKLFDVSLSILSICALAFLIRLPSARRYLLTGIFVGMIAVFGRNHGLYAVVGSAGVILWLRLLRSEGPGLIRGGMLWVAGVVVGYLPVLSMAATVPRFGRAFVATVVALFQRGATNTSVPIPWPWRVDFSSIPSGAGLRGVLIGSFFLAIAFFGVASIVWVVRRASNTQPPAPEFVSASFLALPYAHFAFSRADVNHLAQGVFPFLLGVLILLLNSPPVVKWCSVATLAFVSFWIMYAYHPGFRCMAPPGCVEVEVSRNRLWVDPGTATEIALLRRVVRANAPHGESFFVAPFWPGAYALFERKAPVWETYALIPRSAKFENEEIERLKRAGPTFALIYDLPLDGRDDLRFRNTHPLTTRFIDKNFEKAPALGTPGLDLYLPNAAVP